MILACTCLQWKANNIEPCTKVFSGEEVPRNCLSVLYVELLTDNTIEGRHSMVYHNYLKNQGK